VAAVVRCSWRGYHEVPPFAAELAWRFLRKFKRSTVDAAAAAAATATGTDEGAGAGAYTRSHFSSTCAPLSTASPNLSQECVLELLKLSSNVNESKVLVGGEEGHEKRIGAVFEGGVRCQIRDARHSPHVNPSFIELNGVGCRRKHSLPTAS
jgi:hypothetical protein